MAPLDDQKITKAAIIPSENPDRSPMPSEAADFLRHQRNTIAAQKQAQQFDQTNTVGWFERSYGSTADIRLSGGDRIRVNYPGGVLQVGQACNVQVKGYKYVKGFEGL